MSAWLGRPQVYVYIMDACNLLYVHRNAAGHIISLPQM